MPADIAKKMGVEVKDFDPAVKEELDATLAEKTKVRTHIKSRVEVTCLVLVRD